MTRRLRALGLASVGLLGLTLSTAAFAAGAVEDKFKWMTFAVFGCVICVTMMITYWAAKRTTTTVAFYAAGRSVSGIQNGWAIAGDYLSAASFLGIAGLISLYGYDGFMYSVGWLVAYITVLLVMAEPCRNIGKYTMGDILAFRNDPRTTKIVAALSTIMVSTFYLTAQMVGGALLIRTLIGVEYEYSVIAVGILMISYVVFGGMIATTWVQIVKAVLLVTASILLVFLVWVPYGFSLPVFLADVVADAKVQARVAAILGDGARALTGAELGQRFLEPGLLLKNPIDQISLGMALVLGTAGMPHILMRFFTVPTAKAARVSVNWAMAIIGGFYVLTLILGMGAAKNVGPSKIASIDLGGNMANPLLAQFVGGGAESILGNLFLAFVSAVAFATIVAVVAGLVLAAASAMAHDLYVGVIKGNRASQAEQVAAARISSVTVGVVAVIIGILAKGQNVAHLVALAFAVAASGNLPCVLLTLYWRKCNTGGIVAGMVCGSMTAIVLMMVSPTMTYPKLETIKAQKIIALQSTKLLAAQATLATATDPAAREKARKDAEIATRTQTTALATITRFEGQTTSMMGLEEPLFGLRNPGIISIPVGFLAVFLGSLFTRDRRAEEMWDELYVRQHTGIHAAQ